ncbi:PREDICTED: DNA-directed RNA polymerase III subunit RPC9 [Tarenaya hassleriana]|uniref:DNA-directed RNA polymerase III subunit RPC9 n=1 Tax=Tarenaya hassleriana TaxID=28532 RepID=UPI00053C3CFC|nr:PREDICTED: DNA-directed RNA polymerase III subunit RPC9 [Tarenaya hassleriana]XP_010558374.1 PREDICTED: DNA-directed RNA polymerase III subunit RPC9 [Tarenaya hassleriana]
MKIIKANAGSLTNFEVLDFLKSRGASKDPTRVIAPISRSEYKVYDYLVETPAFTQTRESVNTFAEKCKGFKLAKAEILNIINLRPSSIVDLQTIVEKLDDREIDTDGLLELVKEVLPPVPGDEGAVREETENGDGDGTADDGEEPMETS